MKELKEVINILNSLYRFIEKFISNNEENLNIDPKKEEQFKKLIHQTIHSVTL